MNKQNEFTLEKIQEYSKKQRKIQTQESARRPLYSIVVSNIISMASHGYTQYIHPIDRGLWRDDEISFTKWKLKSNGFNIDHRGRPSTWSHLIQKIFGNPEEYLVVKWAWTNTKDKRHFQWD